MKYLENYQQHQEMNEGLKNWLSSFLILSTLGLVPPSVALSQNRQEKREFVENVPKDKLDAALFVDYLNGLDVNRPDLSALFDKFKSENPKVNSNFEDVQKYVNRSGKKFLFDQKYTQHDYSGVDIMKFQPDNWLMDLGNMIEDGKEPEINNWISNYEKQTSVEINVVTINKLPEDLTAEEYAVKHFKRIGIGKRGANNGVLIVLSKEDHKWQITTGYGMEGILTDFDCSKIGEEHIVPNFRKGDFYGGVMEALEAIKSVVGTQEIELKKEWMEKKKIADDRASAEFWSKFWNVSLEALVALLFISLVAYTVYKKRQKMKEEKERKEEEARELQRMQNSINKILANIRDLKSKLPDSVESGSKSLNSIYDSCRKYFDSISLPNTEYSTSFEDEMDSIYDRMISLFGNFKLKADEISKFKSSIGELKGIETNAYSDIEKAIQNAKKIVDYGYDAKSVPAKTEIDSLHSLIPQITTLISSDIDSAMVIYKQYLSGISSVSSKGYAVASTLSSIEGAISRVKNWKSEVNALSAKFKQASGDTNRLNSMVNSFESKLSTTKDWFVLCNELDKIISFMKSEIASYEEEQRRERQRRDDARREEQRRADDARREQQRRDEQSNSYSSSSSSYSSGGGDTGGGGAGGSW